MSNLMPSKLVKKLVLDLEGIPLSDRNDAKDDVGDFLINEVIRHLERGKSPVQGETFKKLTKEYADNEKQGNRTPNLNLEGDLREATDYKRISGGIEYGTYGSKEADKADGHNQLSGKAKSWASKKDFPKRRYIADKKQVLKRSISSGIEKILDSYRVDEQELEIEEIEASEQVTEISVSDLFGVSLFEDL